MTIEESKKLVRELTQAAIAHYQSVNESSRKNPETACKKEAKATWKILTALTDSPISQQDVDDCMT